MGGLSTLLLTHTTIMSSSSITLPSTNTNTLVTGAPHRPLRTMIAMVRGEWEARTCRGTPGEGHRYVVCACARGRVCLVRVRALVLSALPVCMRVCACVCVCAVSSPTPTPTPWVLGPSTRLPPAYIDRDGERGVGGAICRGTPGEGPRYVVCVLCVRVGVCVECECALVLSTLYVSGHVDVCGVITHPNTMGTAICRGTRGEGPGYVCVVCVRACVCCAVCCDERVFARYRRARLLFQSSAFMLTLPSAHPHSRICADAEPEVQRGEPHEG